MSFDLISILTFYAPLVMVGIALFVGGWQRTLAYLGPGAGVFILGLFLTAVMRGNVIFIGAIIVGAFMFLRGFYYVIADA